MDIKIDMQSDIEALQREIEQELKKDIASVCIYTGLEATNYARDRSKDDSWEDQTGNLRSSVGAKTMIDGEVIRTSGFRAVEKGADGVKEGKDYADEVLSGIKDNDYALVLVAGMDYAGYVEAIEGKDVLASAELFAKAAFEKRRARIANKQYLK